LFFLVAQKKVPMFNQLTFRQFNTSDIHADKSLKRLRGFLRVLLRSLEFKIRMQKETQLQPELLLCSSGLLPSLSKETKKTVRNLPA
jgi:hypothetical protein